MHVPQAAEGPLSFTVPFYGAAQGRLPERPKGAVCKTVGFAYVGSNPTPATTCGNGPWPGAFSASRAAALGPLTSRCVHASPAVSGCARTYSGQRPGWTSGPPNRLSPGCAGLPEDCWRVSKPSGRSLMASSWPTHRQDPSAAQRVAADPGPGGGLAKGCCRSAVRLSVRAWRRAPRCSAPPGGPRRIRLQPCRVTVCLDPHGPAVDLRWTWHVPGDLAPSLRRSNIGVTCAFLQGQRCRQPARRTRTRA